MFSLSAAGPAGSGLDRNGCGQALAVIPGLSRSGTTISVGMMRGFDRAFAVRFSMKEAVFKALRMSPDDARFGQIEYVTDELGRPSVTLSGSMDAVAREQGPYRLHVSASYENDYASTLAVLETGESPLASTE